MKDPFQRYIEDACDAEGDFERGRVLVAFDGNDGLACDTNSIGEFLLRHIPCRPKFSNPIAYGGHQSGFRYDTI